MKSQLLLGAALLAGMAGQVFAANAAPVNRVIAIMDVETDDPSGYAHWIGEGNKIAKEKIGVSMYQEVFQTVYDGEKTGSVRVVRTAESVAALQKNSAALENDPGLRQLRDHFRAIRKTGAWVLFQGVRFEGWIPGAHVQSTLVNVTDEAAYISSLDEMRALLDKAGFKDAKISAYRVIAGRTNYTHRVTFAVPSAERLAQLLDALQRDDGIREWVAKSAKYRTVVSNATARNITP